MSERDWENGHRAAWRAILSMAIKELGYGNNTTAELASELEDARVALRRVCEDQGDNDWSADLHLADVIEKHLERHLGDR